MPGISGSSPNPVCEDEGELDRLEIFLWEFPKGKKTALDLSMGGLGNSSHPVIIRRESIEQSGLDPWKGREALLLLKESVRSALGRNPGNFGTTGWVRSRTPKFPFSPWKFQRSFGMSSLTLSPSAWKCGMWGLDLIPTIFTHYPGKGIPGEPQWDVPAGKLFQGLIPGNPGRFIPVGIPSFHVKNWNWDLFIGN